MRQETAALQISTGLMPALGHFRQIETLASLAACPL
jgi:hypothetical protein